MSETPSGTTAPPAEPTGQGQPTLTDDAQLPSDHPLVKTLTAQKDEIKRLKAAADGSKTEADKVAERLAEYERKVTEAEARATRREVALEHKLSREDAALLDAITNEDAMRSLAARLAQQADVKPKGNQVPREGMNQTATTDERRAFLRQLTGRE